MYYATEIESRANLQQNKRSGSMNAIESMHKDRSSPILCELSKQEFQQIMMAHLQKQGSKEALLDFANQKMIQ